MSLREPRLRLQPAAICLLAVTAGIWLSARYVAAAQTPPANDPKPLQASFARVVQPFFQKNCLKCHNSDASVAGVRVDQLTPDMEDRHISTWEAVRRRVAAGTMPPKGTLQPTAEERQALTAWIDSSLELARLRPAPKNGLIRRLTVAQYRNTLRSLLQIDDDLTSGLPPDAISKDGFVNSKDTLQLSPLLTEAYFDIADKALDRVLIDPDQKPAVENFRVDLGRNVNPAPLAEKLILGAGSALLENADVLVTQMTPVKPFSFEPVAMRTRYRFIEGYRGNDTVRGWRDFDSIYHAVFADMRGSQGYPKGDPYNVLPEGLVLRPAIPTDEIFGEDSTYGPKANFKISVRQLPDDGPFRVMVTAARYNDGLLLEPSTKPQPEGAADAIVIRDPLALQSVNIAKPGVYQVDVYRESDSIPAPDGSHLTDGLTGIWPADQEMTGKLEGKASLISSPLGKTLSLGGGSDALVVGRKELPMNDSQLVGEGDFTVAAWVQPRQAKRAAIISMAGNGAMQGWYLEMDDRGGLRFRTAGQDPAADAMVVAPGVIRADKWQHVAVVVRRGRNETMLYVNGCPAARKEMGSAQFDDPQAGLRIGNTPGSQPFKGDIAAVHLYRRPLEAAEIQALVQPGKEFVVPPKLKPEQIRLSLGDREFSGAIGHPAFLAVRLKSGPLTVFANGTGVHKLNHIVLTPLHGEQEAAREFARFEKRAPRLGVHLGLRRDCGSTLAPVGPPQTVSGEKLARYVFEGTMRNFPSPEVEKDNINYLAGVREIGVRSEYSDGRDMPRLVIRSVEFEGPYYEQWPPKSYRNIFVDFDRKSDKSAYARKIITSFASRAYRRPVTAAEETTLMGVYNKSANSGLPFRQSIKDALLVVLTSPQFLFLVESSKSPAPEPLDTYELSSKLSYFLWNGPPDQKLQRLAAEGTLQKQLDSEVTRMIADARFTQFTREFTSQWLSLDKFSVLEPDKKRYPRLTISTRAQLRQEPIEFVQYLIRNNLPVRNLISSDLMVANEAVASYYDLPEKTESGLNFVAFPHGRRELGGLLTQAALMAGLSDGRESNPVKRGAWVARKIISEPPNDPPPNVPALGEDTKGLTLRQRLEQHRSQTGCMQCHSRIDPWGVAFEEFDAGGRLKAQHADAHSVLPDKTEVSGANDLKRYLSEDRIDQIAYSVLRHLAVYACGRALTYNEQDFLKRDAPAKLKANGYRMQDMVRYIVNSKIFLEK